MSATKAISEWESVQPYLGETGWVIVGSDDHHQIHYATAEAAAREINRLRNNLQGAYDAIKEITDAKNIVSDIIGTTDGAISDSCE